MDRLPDRLAAAYVELLGIDAVPGQVDASMLAAIVRAHVMRIPYENVDIYRGRPPGIDPLHCVERVLNRRGGYCYHLNGALVTLLEWLGVDVTRHVAGVQRRGSIAPGPIGSHLGVTVRTPDGEEWLVDAGFGDGPAEPLPLVFGVHEQDGFRYELRPSSFDRHGWRFKHDPSGSFAGADFLRAPAVTDDFQAMHEELSTSATSGFVRIATVSRRTLGGVDVLRGCVHSTITPTAVTHRDVDLGDDWWSLVIDHFGLAYAGLALDERLSVWKRVRASHEAWDTAGRP